MRSPKCASVASKPAGEGLADGRMGCYLDRELGVVAGVIQGWLRRQGRAAV